MAVITRESAASTRRAGVRGRGVGIERRQAIAGYLFVAPAMVIFVVFTLLPVLYALFLSFTNYDVFTRRDWIGTLNYELIWEDLVAGGVYWEALRNTAYYTAVSIPLSMAIGLGLALLLNQKLRGLGFYRTVYYVPVVTSMVAVAMIWVQLFDPLYGVVSN